MTEQLCNRCGATLTDDYCEYCGWNSSKAVFDKTLTLSGLLCSLTVTKEICTFKPKVGSPSVIANKEITQISLLQAPVTGTGELSILTVTGIAQKVTFLYPQNPNMEEIASYLLKTAPEAQFVNISPTTADSPTDVGGVLCPRCGSKKTKMTGESRKFSVWKIILGVMLFSMGVRVSAGGIMPQLLMIGGGVALVATGLRLIGKKKSDCICMRCRKRFQV